MSASGIMRDPAFIARIEKLCVMLEKANRRRRRYDIHAASIRAALEARDANDMWLKMRSAEAALASMLLSAFSVDDGGVPAEMWPAYVDGCEALGLPRPEEKLR